MKVELKNIVKRYGKFAAVKGVDLTLNSGELTAIIGPSGCGKTTLLRVLAGLTEQDEGSITIGDTDVTHTAPQKRNAVLVFQGYALFPHLNVWDNVSFGLVARKIERRRRDEMVRSVIETMQLGEHAQKPVQQLSGGQQQRVALARALVTRPSVLLFDEPLSNLDEKLRVSMRSEIREIQRQHRITSLYVTHDQVEALSIADRIAVMFAGNIHQVGSPKDIYYRPADPEVARFVGQANIMTLPVVMAQGEELTLKWGGEEVSAIAQHQDARGEALCMIRPEELSFGSSGVAAQVIRREILGSICRFVCEDEAGRMITVEALNRAGAHLPQQKERVMISLSEGSAYVF